MTGFERSLKNIAKSLNLQEKLLLSLHARIVASAYRVRSGDYSALDIQTYRNGSVAIFKNNRRVSMNDQKFWNEVGDNVGLMLLWLAKSRSKWET
ncbi:hypothetical protein A3F62_04830 [Candidatus Woesebacteria bacterium RIFCSPHIGHO2_12_FULL_44_11]|nr:MAG: hypothetical protein A3F62_04830 [Candidatus Woesebacteria bacterium RIFCSPHIGHO2_12_FULL_44_11]